MSHSEPPVRVLVVGWPSFLHGEATAGDVLAMEALRVSLTEAGIWCELAWSPVFRPGGLTLEEADPGRYTHLVFTCGPVHGPLVERLHDRYRSCRRIAVGVSVPDPDEPAAAGFHAIFPRDAPGATPQRDLAARVPVDLVPVTGIVLAGAQPEYGVAGRHGPVTEQLTAWLHSMDCARVPLDTRLDSRDWRSCRTPAQLESIIARLDIVVTTRLHGLVLALKNQIPALAVDPVAGGAKVAGQAAAWGWPVLTSRPGESAVHPGELDALWRWCLSADAKAQARTASISGPPGPPLSTVLLGALGRPRLPSR
jgi:Polysaccharide pyruvyl transferase